MRLEFFRRMQPKPHSPLALALATALGIGIIGVIFIMFGLVPWLKVYGGIDIGDAVTRGFRIAAIPGVALMLVGGLGSAWMAREWNRSDDQPTVVAYPPPAAHAQLESRKHMRAIYPPVAG